MKSDSYSSFWQRPLSDNLLRRLHGLARPSSLIFAAAFFICAAMLLPLIYLFIRGAWAGEEAWVLLFRWRTVQIFGRSAILTIAVTGFSLALALPVAWLTARTDLPLKRFWSVVTALPLVVPSYVGAYLMISAIGPKGLLQKFLLSPFGVERLPEMYGLVGATLVLSLLSYPYILLTVRGSLANLDPSLDEASRILGHGPWRTFTKNTLPQLRPSITTGGMLVALYTLSDFGAVSLMRYETFTWAIYQQYQSAYDRSIAALLSLVLVATAIALLSTEAICRGRQRYYRTSPGAALPPPLLILGAWRWLATGFSALLAILSLALPLVVLIFWLIRGLFAGESVFIPYTPAANSLLLSGITALIAVIFSFPVAFVSVRYTGIISGLVEKASFMGYALPGVVVGLSLVYFGSHFAKPLYQTLWLLIFACLVLYFPAALAAIRTALLQVNPRLEEAARGLGKNSLQTFMAVTVPTVRRGVMMGAALVFLITMKELPAVLMLSPLEFSTLTTEIWTNTSEAFFAKAAVPSIALIILSSLPLGYLLLGHNYGSNVSTQVDTIHRNNPKRNGTTF